MAACKEVVGRFVGADAFPSIERDVVVGVDLSIEQGVRVPSTSFSGRSSLPVGEPVGTSDSTTDASMDSRSSMA